MKIAQKELENERQTQQTLHANQHSAAPTSVLDKNYNTDGLAQFGSFFQEARHQESTT